MKLGLGIFAFDRAWLDEDRVAALQAAFELATPTKAGASDPLRRYHPGMLVELYREGARQVFVDGPEGRTSGQFEETFAAKGGGGAVGECIIRLRTENLEALRALRRFATWLGGLPECAFGTWCEPLDQDQYDSEFCDRGSRTPRYLSELGLPRLGTLTFFGAEVAERIGEDVLDTLGAVKLGDGNFVVELEGEGLTGDQLVEGQEQASAPLIATGLVAPFMQAEGFGEPAPSWRPLHLVHGWTPKKQPPFHLDAPVSSTTPSSSASDPGPLVEKLRARWRQVETDTDLEDQQQAAMAVLDELADLLAEHPDRLDLLKYRVQLLAYPLEQWEDVRREMAPLREVPEYAEMIARFDQERSVQPFS